MTFNVRTLNRIGQLPELTASAANNNAHKLKKTQRELTNTYQKEQKEYIQAQINKMRNSVDLQSGVAWQTVNEVHKRKRTSRAKQKAANQEKRILMWKEFAWKLSQSLRLTYHQNYKLPTRTNYSRRTQRSTNKS